jgi:WD40 repeat protein
MGGQSRTNGMVFSPDQGILATGSLDNKVLLRDVGTGLLLHTLEEHPESVLVLAFSPKAPYVPSGSKDKTFRIWE